MKRIAHLLVPILLLGFWALPCYGQRADTTLAPARGQNRMPSPQEFQTVLKSNPFAILWGPIPLTAEYKLGYEVTTSKRQSSQVMMSYLGKSPLVAMIESDITNPNNQDIKLLIRGFRLQAQQRFFITDDYAPSGWYVAPHISYASAIISNRYLNQYDLYIRGSHFNVNALVGYQTFWFDNLSFEAFVGLGYKRNWWVERLPSGTNGLNLDDFGPLYNGPLKISIGYTFGIGF